MSSRGYSYQWKQIHAFLDDLKKLNQLRIKARNFYNRVRNVQLAWRRLQVTKLANKMKLQKIMVAYKNNFVDSIL